MRRRGKIGARRIIERNERMGRHAKSWKSMRNIAVMHTKTDAAEMKRCITLAEI